MERLGRLGALVIVAACIPSPLQAQRKFPPDSLINPKVFDKQTPVITVIGTMRNFAGWLGVRCQHCHVGEEGLPLEQFDFASDEKRTKQTARLMMRMVADVNRKLAEVPERPSPAVEVTCFTCHRGVPRPVPILDILGQAATAGGADSAIRAYRSLREQFHGRAAYDFGESTLNIFAGRLSRANQFDDALKIVTLNAEFFPGASSVPFTRGEVLLARRDTAGAVSEYRKAVAIDGNAQAQLRLSALAPR